METNNQVPRSLDAHRKIPIAAAFDDTMCDAADGESDRGLDVSRDLPRRRDTVKRTRENTVLSVANNRSTINRRALFNPDGPFETVDLDPLPGAELQKVVDATFVIAPDVLERARKLSPQQ